MTQVPCAVTSGHQCSGSTEMTSNELHVFWREDFIGTFVRDRRGNDPIAFHYDDDAGSRSISLSLPRQGGHTQAAPARFLDNLLPDNPAVRVRWAKTLGVPNTAFDLIGRVGEDIAGGLVFLPDGHEPEPRTDALHLASDDEIAARIADLKRDPSAWLSPEELGKTRMSLAGAQGKFTLARLGDGWAWSNREYPSTHILKPAQPRFGDLHELEAGSLALAREAGLATPAAGSITFFDQSSYIVERFDRFTSPNGVTQRRHIEDFAQALAVTPEQKYTVGAKRILDLLKDQAVPEAPYQFVQMLAFNVLLGNADAHAKNYSLDLESPTPALTPLYDVIPTVLWPELDNSLAMKVGNASYPQAATIQTWTWLAQKNQLDPYRVVDMVRNTATVIRERSHDVYAAAGASPATLQRLDVALNITTSGVFPTSKTERSRKTTPDTGQSRTNTRRSAVGDAATSTDFVPAPQEGPGGPGPMPPGMGC